MGREWRLEVLEDRDLAYSFYGSSAWPTADLTYEIVGPVTAAERAATARALDVWASLAPLQFTERSDGARLRLRFDRDLPAGEGGSASPPPTGDVRVGRSVPLAELPFVTAHEIGHALGLGHSSDPRAVMYPAAPGYQGEGAPLVASADDAAGIGALYGVGTGSVTPLDTSAGAKESGSVPISPYGAFAGEVSTASADLDHDGVLDSIYVAQGAQGHVRSYDGFGVLTHSFYAFPGFYGGVSLAAGGDRYAALAERQQGHLVTDRGGVLAFPGYYGDVSLSVGSDGVVQVTAEVGPGRTHVERYDGQCLIYSEIRHE